VTSARERFRDLFTVPAPTARKEALNRLRTRVCVINFRTMDTLCGWPISDLGPDEVPGVRWVDRDRATCPDCLAKLTMHEKTGTRPQ
jgi:hypothetical protein